MIAKVITNGLLNNRESGIGNNIALGIKKPATFATGSSLGLIISFIQGLYQS